MFNDFTHRDHSTAAPNAKSQRFNLSEKQQSKQLTSEKKHRFSTMLNTVALNELMLPHTKLSPLLLGFVFYNSEFLQLLCTYLEPKYFPSLNVDHPNDRNNVTVFISVYTLPSVRAVLEGWTQNNCKSRLDPDVIHSYPTPRTGPFFTSSLKIYIKKEYTATAWFFFFKSYLTSFKDWRQNGRQSEGRARAEAQTLCLSNLCQGSKNDCILIAAASHSTVSQKFSHVKKAWGSSHFYQKHFLFSSFLHLSVISLDVRLLSSYNA